MVMPIRAWRMEKSTNLIQGICRILLSHKQGKAPLTDETKTELGILLYDATKLFCNAVEEINEDTSRWSPELSDYLFQFPEKCDETLNIVASEDFRDPYYDDGPLSGC